MIELIVGGMLALVVAGIAAGLGLSRDKAWYALLVMVVASYYPLFALVGQMPAALWPEALVVVVFIGAAVLGFRWSSWLLVLALAAHGVFDAVHARLIHNPGVPPWWPGFCLAFDGVAALCLGVCLAMPVLRRRIRMQTGDEPERQEA